MQLLSELVPEQAVSAKVPPIPVGVTIAKARKSLRIPKPADRYLSIMLRDLVNKLVRGQVPH